MGVKSTHVTLFFVSSDDLEDNHPMAAAAFAVRKGAEDAVVELAELHEGFSLGSAVHTELAET
jgi:hypothetical protein